VQGLAGAFRIAEREKKGEHDHDIRFRGLHS